MYVCAASSAKFGRMLSKSRWLAASSEGKGESTDQAAAFKIKSHASSGLQVRRIADVHA
jgi:hypothetical protein